MPIVDIFPDARSAGFALMMVLPGLTARPSQKTSNGIALFGYFLLIILLCGLNVVYYPYDYIERK